MNQYRTHLGHRSFTSTVTVWTYRHVLYWFILALFDKSKFVVIERNNNAKVVVWCDLM